MLINRNLSNLQIAKLLHSVAGALTLDSEEDNRFRITAYDRAADAIEHSSSELKDLWDDGNLSDLAGIGENIASYLDELFRTGRVPHFKKILSGYPEAVYELMEIPGIGPKTAQKLCKALGISKAKSSLIQLERAAKKGHIRLIEGFGEESEKEILEGIAQHHRKTGRLLLPQAQAIANSLITWISGCPQVQKVDFLGSLRRQAATIGDIDISVASSDASSVIKRFVSYPKLTRVIDSGDRTASILVPPDCQIDLMVQPPEQYGSLLQHFTGSKLHNIALREYALKQGYSLSEYGIKSLKQAKNFNFSDEKSFYNFLGLDYIPPEIRENNGEISLALEKNLPQLVEDRQIKGDLHIHSDIDTEPSHDLGKSSLLELVNSASILNYEYIGLNDHNPGVSNHTESQILDLLKRRKQTIEQFMYSLENRTIYLFNGMEIDILSNGSLALPDSALGTLDYASVAVHSAFNQSRKIMTQRVISALDHPKVLFLAHPTGRLLNKREGVELDWDKIFDFCVTHDKWLEIDAWPNRLDLPDSLVKTAVKGGVKLIINTDSHDAENLQNIRFGVSVARRGWSTQADIINTRGLEEIKSLILKGR